MNDYNPPQAYSQVNDSDYTMFDPTTQHTRQMPVGYDPQIVSDYPSEVHYQNQQPVDHRFPDDTRMAGPRIKRPKFHIFQFLTIVVGTGFICFVLAIACGQYGTAVDQITGLEIKTWSAASWPFYIWIMIFIGALLGFGLPYRKALADQKDAIANRHRW